MDRNYIPQSYPHKTVSPVSLTLGSHSTDDNFSYPLVFSSCGSYFDFDNVGNSYSKRLLSVLFAALDRIVISVSEMYYVLGYEEFFCATYESVRQTFKRCVREGLLVMIPLGVGELFYGTDRNVYILTDKGLDVVSKYRRVDKRHKAKIKKVRENAGTPGSRVEHMYGNDICSFQTAAAFQRVFSFNTDLGLEGFPVNYFSDYGRGEIEKANESPFTFDAFVSGAGTDDSAFVFMEYDRNTEGTGVLNDKLADYCATSGYISSLPLVNKPGVDNTCIVFACDSGKPYKDRDRNKGETCINVCKRIRDAVGERTWANDVLTALKSCMKDKDTVEFTKEGKANICRVWGFDERHAAALVKILTYYLESSDVNSGKTAYELLDTHIESLVNGINPMRADIIREREEFYTLKRLLGVLKTYTLQLYNIMNRTYKPPLTPSAEVKMLDGLSVMFVPAVSVGFYACCGCFCDSRLKDYYITLAKKYAGSNEEPVYMPVADFHGGLKLPFDRTDLFLRNTVQFGTKYVHIENLCDLGAWIRVYGFISLMPEEKKGHIVILLCSDVEKKEIKERMANYDMRGIYFENREKFFSKTYAELIGGDLFGV